MNMMENTKDRAELSVDAFHRGDFVLVQPKNGGHRAGVDAMLLASCVPDGFSGHLADLGSGSGAAAFAVLNRCSEAKACLFEASNLMVQCAKDTLARPENTKFVGRAEIHHVDVTASSETRTKHGLKQNHFDWIIANPPFNESDDRRSPHSERAFAHVMDGKTIELWSRTAASIANADARFSMILRPQSLGEILAGYMGRFGSVRITPVHPRQGEDAIRLLVTGQKGSRKKPEITSPIFLHEVEGRDFTAEADALINGIRSL